VKKSLSGSDTAIKAYDALGPADNGASTDRRPSGDIQDATA
jgi:hypothetical protein